jgi:ADP-heptose:LPS heptosyltransferase
LAEQPSNETPNNLVYHAGALGDFITTFPALVCWRARCPADRILFLGHRAHGVLAAAAGIVDQVIDIDAAASLPFFRPDRKANPKLAAIEQSLLFTRPGSPLESALVHAGCRRITRQDPFPAHPMPVVAFHLSLFPDHPPLRRLYQPLRKLARQEGNTSCPKTRMILIHPGSGGREKIWPAERFLELATRLNSDGFQVGYCLGPAEEAGTGGPFEPAYSSLSLLELCSLLGRTRLFIGNDAGVTHLAAALGVPTLALFGPSDRSIWAPSAAGAPVIVLSPTDFQGRPITGPMKRITLEMAYRAATRLLRLASND